MVLLLSAFSCFSLFKHFYHMNKGLLNMLMHHTSSANWIVSLAGGKNISMFRVETLHIFGMLCPDSGNLCLGRLLMIYYHRRMLKFVFSPAESKAPLWRDVLPWEDYDDWDSSSVWREERSHATG